MRKGSIAGVAAAGCAVMLGGCSRSGEWRELRPPDSGIVAMFPCKPDRHARTLSLGGRATRMEMLVCSTDGATFALAFADIAEPAAVTPALAELRDAAIANVGGTAVRDEPLQVPGMTPNPRAVRIRLHGRRPDGAPVQEQAAFFVYGLRVYQASVLAPVLPEATAQAFIGALRLGA